MLLRSLLAAAMLLGACGAASATITASFVYDFDAQGPGVSENPCVGGFVSIVSREELPGQVDTIVTGVVYGLQPNTTYDFRIETPTIAIGLPDALVTNAFGFRYFRFVIDDAPAAFTDQPIVDVFIDEDGELLDPHTANEPRASGSGC